MTSFSPYYKILSADRVELNLHIKFLKYVYDEALEDFSVIKAETDDASYVDRVEIQEDQAIYLVWGNLGDKSSETIRKVYIVNSAADFTASGLELTLSCFPRAAYLKSGSKNIVRNNTDLPSVVGEVAGNLGIEVDDQVSNGGSGLQILQTGFAKPSEPIFEKYDNPNNPDDPRNGESRLTGVTSASDSARVRKDYVWKTYESLPQANKSDAGLIDDLKNNEPLDNLVVSGRDDKITIRKRDFSQTPIWAYIWQGGTGHLLSFKSGITNTFNRSKSMLNTTDGWQAESKTFISGDVKNTLEGSELLGSVVPVNPEEILRKEIEGYPGNVQYYGLFEEYEEEDEDGNKLVSRVKNDELNGNLKYIFRERKGYVLGKNTTDGYLLEHDVVSRIESRGIIPVRHGKHNSSIESTPEDIAGTVIQESSERTLELNKSSALTIGNRLLTDGRLIRVTGVGKKYSGNWYITKATHTVDDSGWLVSLEITRNARGPAEELLLGTQTASELNKKVNNENLELGDDFVVPSEISD